MVAGSWGSRCGGEQDLGIELHPGRRLFCLSGEKGVLGCVGTWGYSTYLLVPQALFQGTLKGGLGVGWGQIINSLLGSSLPLEREYVTQMSHLVGSLQPAPLMTPPPPSLCPQ